MTKGQNSLTKLLMSRLSIFLIGIMALATPVFYMIITNYYAEDLMDVARIAHVPESELDLEEDTVIGLVYQVLLTCGVLGLSIFLMMKIIPQRLWSPFYETLSKLKNFKVEEGRVPEFESTEVMEFTELNQTLTKILSQSVNSFQVQKEFTENASHELQTPLAILQAKIGLMLQDDCVTEKQSVMLEDIYHEVRRMSRLNQDLLLLARMENVQYRMDAQLNVAAKLREALPSLNLIANGRSILSDISPSKLIMGNEVLLESMISNLVVNAIRHSETQGEIHIVFHDGTLIVSNSSSEGPISPENVFKRFYKTNKKHGGNGLGLAIVKSICDYHHWLITYSFNDGHHIFSVKFY